MSAEMLHMDNRRDAVAQNDMFQSMTLDTTDACNNMITISFGQAGESRHHHQVIEPIHLRIKQNGDGKKHLQIEAENGVTLLTFHSGRFPEQEFESEFSSFAKGKEAGVVQARD